MRPAVRFAALLVVAAVAVPAQAGAQSKPNLTGTWVMVPEKSDLAGMPSPGGRTDVIDHQEPKLTVKRTVGDVHLDLTYAVDGKPWTNQTPQGPVTSTLKWDGDVLVIASEMNVQGNDVSLEDRYTLSADGKTLTQDRTINVQGQTIVQKLVFAKQ